MQKSIIEKLIEYFLECVAYNSFILSKEKPLYRKVIKSLFPITVLAAIIASLYISVTSAPAILFILPILFLFIVNLSVQRFFEKKSGVKMKGGYEVKSKRLNVLKAYLKENRLLKKQILKFMIHQIAVVNKPAKQVSPIGFALLLTIGIYFSDALDDGLWLYTNMFKKNTISTEEREFWIKVSSITYILCAVFLLYSADKLRILFQNYKFTEVTNLVKMLEDIYIIRERDNK